MRGATGSQALRDAGVEGDAVEGEGLVAETHHVHAGEERGKKPLKHLFGFFLVLLLLVFLLGTRKHAFIRCSLFFHCGLFRLMFLNSQPLIRNSLAGINLEC